ncbi:hypothetical protein [Moraxella lacunata]|uniref:hypothetical protein n=1 Tax=Moraxella lacunata TaxID=477 RepID=UPI003EE36431
MGGLSLGGHDILLSWIYTVIVRYFSVFFHPYHCQLVLIFRHFLQIFDVIRA